MCILLASLCSWKLSFPWATVKNLVKIMGTFKGQMEHLVFFLQCDWRASLNQSTKWKAFNVIWPYLIGSHRKIKNLNCPSLLHFLANLIYHKSCNLCLVSVDLLIPGILDNSVSVYSILYFLQFHPPPPQNSKSHCNLTRIRLHGDEMIAIIFTTALCNKWVNFCPMTN